MKEIIAEQLSVDARFHYRELPSFKDDLGADSLDLFELVMALEDRVLRKEITLRITEPGNCRRCYELLKRKRCRGIMKQRSQKCWGLNTRLFRAAWHGWQNIIWQQPFLKLAVWLNCGNQCTR